MKILLFHINIFKLDQIRSLCSDLKMEVYAATEQDLAKTIGQIAGVAGQAAPIINGRNAVPSTEEMMVFCGADPDALDRFLTAYRNREILPIPYKAVMTPYNMQWTPGRLCMELRKEHQAMQDQTRQK